jgi:hypothetical protein
MYDVSHEMCVCVLVSGCELVRSKRKYQQWGMMVDWRTCVVLEEQATHVANM